jgi:CheY-like chemotaxis protein
MSEVQGSKKKVLVVDDEPNVVAYLETLLQDNGYETISAADGEEGLALARAQRPDLVSLDITMPKKSGVAMYRAMRDDEALASIPIVVVTAVTGYAGRPEEFEKFLSTRRAVRPPDGFLAKPIVPEELLALLAKILGPATS